MFFALFTLIIWSCNVIQLKFWRRANSTFTVEFNISIPPPCQWNAPLCSYFGSVRCLHISYQSNSLGGNRLSYACHCSMVQLLYHLFFFLENKAKKPAKTTGTKFKFQNLKKGLHFREQFYSSSEHK